MLKLLKQMVILFFLLYSCGCAYFYGDKGVIKNRDTDYLKAQSIPPLRIPPGLSSSTMEPHYPVSDQSYPTGTRRIGLVPPELNPPQQTTTQLSGEVPKRS